MSSQIKPQPNVLPNVVPEVVNGESFFAELGVVRFKWTIRDFKGFLNIGQTISSPSFNMETSNTRPKVRSFHLEMEIPSKAQDTKYPIYLVNEEGGEILTKITLEGWSPEYRFRSVSPYVSVCSESGSAFHSLGNRKKVMIVTLHSSESSLPNEVTITIKVTLCQPAKKIVS